MAPSLAIRKSAVMSRDIANTLNPCRGNAISTQARVFTPPMRSIVAWSRLFNEREHVVAISTDPDRPTTAWVTIDKGLHDEGSKLSCIYSTDPGQIGRNFPVEAKNEKTRNAVHVTVPPGGVVILQ